MLNICDYRINLFQFFYIGLQAEGQGIEFREIKIKKLE